MRLHSVVGCACTRDGRCGCGCICRTLNPSVSVCHFVCTSTQPSISCGTASSFGHSGSAAIASSSSVSTPAQDQKHNRCPRAASCCCECPAALGGCLLAGHMPVTALAANNIAVWKKHSRRCEQLKQLFSRSCVSSGTDSSPSRFASSIAAACAAFCAAAAASAAAVSSCSCSSSISSWCCSMAAVRSPGCTRLQHSTPHHTSCLRWAVLQVALRRNEPLLLLLLVHCRSLHAACTAPAGLFLPLCQTAVPPQAQGATTS